MARILLVEDSPTVLHVTSETFKSAGHQVVTASDGQQGLSLALEEDVDIIFLDVVLPKANGFQVCRRLKSEPSTAHIPIVLITSKDKDKDKYWGMKHGADAYIVKPAQQNDLLDTLNYLVPG